MKHGLTPGRKILVVLSGLALFLLIWGLFTRFRPESNIRTKVVFIGFDGLEWSIVEGLIREGRMPNFSGLMQNGVRARLRAFKNKYPSPSLWTTMVTGKSPRIHGILNHTAYGEDKYRLIRVRSYHRRTDALWNILSGRGRDSGIINYYATWPPEKIKGFMVSNINPALCGLKDGDVFPAYLAEELNSVTSEVCERVYNGGSDPYANAAADIRRRLDALSVVTSYLLKKFKRGLSLFITYTPATDTAQHIFWKFMEPEFFRHPAWGVKPEYTEKYGNFIKEVYCKADEITGEIIRNIDEDTAVIICSDHGFHRGKPVPEAHLDRMNRLLEAAGFLYFKDGDESLGIDTARTKAFAYHVDLVRAIPNSLININLKGREPKGIVEPGRQYAAEKRRLINILSDLTIVETGRKLFKGVTESKLEDADISILARNEPALLGQHVKINGRIYPLSDFYSFFDLSGEHNSKDEGVLIIYGKNIRKAEFLEDAHILDIAPTILYLLGLPVAEDMEGEVLTGAITPDFLKANPIEYISTYEDDAIETASSREERASSSLGRKEIKKLRSLGYIQ